MLISKERGFSLIEVVVICTLLLIVSTGCLGDYMNARGKSKEAEVKANCHTIQIALERYATDHSGAYPNYILGGDTRGWDERSGCRAITAPASENESPPKDPLIHFAYMYSYPQNPFLESEAALNFIIASTGSDAELGLGDVRFGWTGEIMGNCLDDPRYLFYGKGEASRLQYTMYPDPDKDIGVLREDGPNSFYCMGKVDTGKTFWPGQFFYRSAGDFFLSDPLNVRGSEYESIWGWPYMRVNKYILGGFGSPNSDGMDIIRLTTKLGADAAMAPGAYAGLIEGEYYQDHNDPSRAASHPDFNVLVGYSNPEIFGGGESGLMPQFPYYESGANAWLFGAPDGYRDGVILVLTSGSDSAKFQEWQG